MKTLDDEKVSDNTTGEVSRKSSSKLDSSNPSLNNHYLQASYADEDSRTTNRPKSCGDVDSSSANKGKQEILVQMRAPKFKMIDRNSLTDSKSSMSSCSLVFNSQDTSAEDVSQGHEHLAASENFDHLVGLNDSDQAESVNIASELTSEYASSSMASGGANGREVRCHIHHVVKGKMNNRSAPSYSEHNQHEVENNIDSNQTSCRSDDVRSEARDSCSVSDIDEIIRRAERAFKSTADSSSSSDELSFSCETRYQVANNTAAEASKSKKKGGDNSSSIGNSSKSSDSFTGLTSLNTACLEGITSDVNVSDGGFSSASSRWENGSKDTASSSSERVKGVEKSSKVDREDKNEKSPRQGDSGIEHETFHVQFAEQVQEFEGSSGELTSLRQTTLSSPHTALTSVAQSNSKPIDIPSVLNTPQYGYEEVRHMLPVHLDYSLLTRMDKVLTSSHESLQMLKEWDKKIGLKPSHSKTMTQSARSRKKLHANIKRMMKKLDALEKKL